MKFLYTFLSTAFLAITANAQITTATMTPAQYVQNVLLGPGVTASNVTYTGLANMIASYTSAPTGNLGINRGVYMTTGANGTIAGDVGPMGPSSTIQSIGNFMPGDAYLDAFANGLGTEDASVLEFDFVPQSDTIRFKYIFGSEEYNEWVGTQFNDVFAFVLTGISTPFPATNIALIPNTTTRISINNVNNGNAGGVSNGPCTNCSYYRDNVNGSISCVYDGLTVVLTAKSHVICGETYHIKLAIADVADGSLDSGVFLEAGSFSSPVPITVGAQNSNANLLSNTQLIEGCNDNCVYFIRGGDVTLLDSFALQVGGTATLGPLSDYYQVGNIGFTWPTKIYFPAGEDSISICGIQAYQDNIVDPGEAISFTVTSFFVSGSACLIAPSATFSLAISEYDPVVIGQGDSSFCNNQTAILVAHASHGVPNYYYSWTPGGGAGSSFLVPPITQTTLFTLTVGDACNVTTTKTISVNVTPTVSVASQSICAGGTVSLTAMGASSYTWSTGSFANPISVSPPITTNYTVTGAIGPCTNTAIGTVFIIAVPTVSITGNNAICDGQSTILTASGTGSSQYTWSEGSTTPLISVSPTVTTTYTVVLGSGNCSAFAIYPVNVTPIPTVTINGSVICSGQTASLTASGASTYVWNTGETGSMLNPMPLTNTEYTVTGANGNCINTAVYTVSVTTATPHLEQVGPFQFCVDTMKQIPVVVTSDNPNYFITWTIPSNGVAPYDTVNKVYYFSSAQPSAGTYTVSITDLCNKKSSIYVDITITNCDIRIPNVITPNGDSKNETFKIYGLDSFTNSVLNVYNRWGKNIYSNEDYKNDWKPDVSSGTYFYVLNLKDGRKFNGFIEVFAN